MPAPPILTSPDEWNISATLGVRLPLKTRVDELQATLDLTPWLVSATIIDGEGDQTSRTGSITLAGRYGVRPRVAGYDPATPARVVDDFISMSANDYMSLTIAAERGEGQDAERHSWVYEVRRVEYDEGREITRLETRAAETVQSWIRRVRSRITSATIRALSTFHSTQDNNLTPPTTNPALYSDMAALILSELDADEDTPARLLRTLHRYAIDVIVDSANAPQLIDYTGRRAGGDVALGMNDMQALARTVDMDNRPGAPNRPAPDNVWQYERRPLRLIRERSGGADAEPEAITIPTANALDVPPIDLGSFDQTLAAAARIACVRRVLSAETAQGKITAADFRPDIRPHTGIAFGKDVSEWAGGDLHWRAGAVKHIFTPNSQHSEIEIAGSRF